MRLKETERRAIVEAVREAFGQETRTYPFGSRTDDRKYGGDIDLLATLRSSISENDSHSARIGKARKACLRRLA